VTKRLLSEHVPLANAFGEPQVAGTQEEVVLERTALRLLGLFFVSGLASSMNVYYLQ
jgi:hypothetical protein